MCSFITVFIMSNGNVFFSCTVSGAGRGKTTGVGGGGGGPADAALPI